MRFQTLSSEITTSKMEVIKKEERETIARLRNCILALAQRKIMLFDTTVQYTYDASLRYQAGLTIYNTITIQLSIILYKLLHVQYTQITGHADCSVQTIQCHVNTVYMYRYFYIMLRSVYIPQVKEMLDPDVIKEITEPAKNVAAD